MRTWRPWLQKINPGIRYVDLETDRGRFSADPILRDAFASMLLPPVRWSVCACLDLSCCSTHPTLRGAGAWALRPLRPCCAHCCVVLALVRCGALRLIFMAWMTGGKNE